MGMAYSAINEGMADENREVSSAGGSEEDNIERASKDSPQKGTHYAVQLLETEKHLKAKEAEFVNTIQDNLIREFEITGTAVAPKTPIESLYLLQKKKQKQKQTMDDVHPQVEVYLKCKFSKTLT